MPVKYSKVLSAHAWLNEWEYKYVSARGLVPMPTHFVILQGALHLCIVSASRALINYLGRSGGHIIKGISAIRLSFKESLLHQSLPSEYLFSYIPGISSHITMQPRWFSEEVKAMPI